MVEFNLKQYIKTKFISVFILQATASLLGFASSIILARFLGATGYGLYAYVMVWVNIIVLFTQFGFANYAPREVSIYAATSKWSLLKGLLKRSHQTVLICSILAIVLGELFLLLIHQHFNNLSIQTAQIGLFILPFMSLSTLKSQFLRGLKFVTISQLPEQLIRPGLFVILIILTHFILRNLSLNPKVVISLQFLCAIIAFIISGFLLKFLSPQELKKHAATYKTTDWLKTSFIFLLLNSVNIIYLKIDILMLGAFKDAKIVGIFKVLTAISTMVAFFITVFNTISAPIIAQLYAEKNIKKLQRVITIGARITTLLTIPIVILLIIFGHWFLTRIYGNIFGELGSKSLIILAISQLLNTLFGSVAMLLKMTGHENEVLKAFYISMLITILLNLIFIPLYGIIGASVVNLASMMTWNLILHFKAKQKLHINTMAFTINLLCKIKNQ